MLRCCRLLRKGRFTVGEPFFESGPYISLANAKRYAQHAGELALVEGTASHGRVLDVLGSPDDLLPVLNGLLGEITGIDELPQDVADQVDAFDDAVPDLESRTDLRGKPCITIDPIDARDFDDAIGFEPGPEGGTLWVHIADVAAYVTTGSPLDMYALNRAMSTYVPGIVAPMLPHRLSSELCSLLPGRDRPAVSVELALDGDNAVQSVSFHRSVIRSMRRLDYDTVDTMIDGESSGDAIVDEQIAQLLSITRSMRTARMAAGALDLGLESVDVRCDQDGTVHAAIDRESPAHALVEECMLAANVAVGELLARTRRTAIFRVHAHPDPEAIMSLLGRLEVLSVPYPPPPDPMVGRDAARFASRVADSVKQHAARGRGRFAYPPMVLRALQRAEYAASPYPHSGLAVESYVHFTSPIRRYPDLVNHRSLLAHIGAADEEACAIAAGDAAEHISFVERELAKVERRADDIALSFLLYGRTVGAGNVDRTWNGEVVSVIPAGAFVRFGELYDGFLPARTIGQGERYELDPSGTALVGATSRHRLQLGDTVEVRVEAIDRARGKLDLRLINPRI
jgi:ribonuclease R